MMMRSISWSNILHLQQNLPTSCGCPLGYVCRRDLQIHTFVPCYGLSLALLSVSALNLLLYLFNLRQSSELLIPLSPLPVSLMGCANHILLSPPRFLYYRISSSDAGGKRITPHFYLFNNVWSCHHHQLAKEYHTYIRLLRHIMCLRGGRLRSLPRGIRALSQRQSGFLPLRRC